MLYSSSGVQSIMKLSSLACVRTTSVRVSVAHVDNSLVASGTCGREEKCVHGVVGEPEGKIQVVG